MQHEIPGLNPFKTRLVRDEDIALLHTWTGDPLWENVLGGAAGNSLESDFRKQLVDDLKGRRPLQILAEIEKQGPIGTAWLFNMNLQHGWAYANTFLVSEFRDRGIGSRLTADLLVRAFSGWPLNKVYLDVHEFNGPSQKALERGVRELGLKREGILRRHTFMRGRRWDLTRYAAYRRIVPRLEKFLSS